MTWWRSVATITIGVAMVGSLSAQWLTIPLSDTPRKADGTPDLMAPAPRTPDGKPDLSGIWIRPRPGGGVPGVPRRAANAPNDGIAAGVDVQFQPWAAELYKARADNNGKGTPSERCLPHGITKAVSVPEPFKIFQLPDLHRRSRLS